MVPQGRANQLRFKNGVIRDAGKQEVQLKADERLLTADLITGCDKCRGQGPDGIKGLQRGVGMFRVPGHRFKHIVLLTPVASGLANQQPAQCRIGAFPRASGPAPAQQGPQALTNLHPAVGTAVP